MVREAFNNLAEGTYALLGPKVERLERHVLQAHGAAERYPVVPRTFDGLREWLHDRDIEGLVFHHPDGRTAKVKRDFGMKRRGSSSRRRPRLPDDPAVRHGIQKRRLSDIFDVIMPCALMEISATCQRRHLINTKPPFGDFMVQNVVREYIERQT